MFTWRRQEFTAVCAVPVVCLTLAGATAIASPSELAVERPRRVSVSSAEEQGWRDSIGPAISAKGRYIVFTSSSARLVPGDSNHDADVFMRDARLGRTMRVSVGRDGTGLPQGGYLGAVSPAARYILINAPRSWNSVNHVYLYNRTLHKAKEIKALEAPFGAAGARATGISRDGNLIVHAHEADDFSMSVFVYNRTTGRHRQISRDNRGRDVGDAYSYNISANGRFVPFSTREGSLFIRNRRTHHTTLVSRSVDGDNDPRGHITGAFISPNGRYVAFAATARNLVHGDRNGQADIFLRDRKRDRTSLVSVNSRGRQGNADSTQPTVSADGRFIAFTSKSDNLVPGDTNGRSDVFIHDTRTGSTRCVSVDSSRRPSAARSSDGFIAADGRAIAFASRSALVRDDTNRAIDVYRIRVPQ